MGDKTIPDSAEPRLESFYPPFVAGIDLPHQGVVDSYKLQCISNGVTAVLHYAIGMQDSLCTIPVDALAPPAGKNVDYKVKHVFPKFLSLLKIVNTFSLIRWYIS